MPLDGHAHLVSQGWSGKGTGLRHGAITRPITIVQKKTLAGIGKDRDEAFPFWDHVFTAASSSIQIKVYKDSDNESDSSDEDAPNVVLQRTKTGIISHRRPTVGTPALSGTATPESQTQASGSVTPRINIMAAAKQEAARRLLYSMFYRGPVLTNDGEPVPPGPNEQPTDHAPTVDARAARKNTRSSEEDVRGTRKRKQSAMVEEPVRKRRRSKGKEKEEEEEEEEDGEEDDGGGARRAAKAERKRLRAEKRARKEQRRQRRVAKALGRERGADVEEGGDGISLAEQGHTPMRHEASLPSNSAASPVPPDPDKKTKKRKKRPS